MPSPPWVVLLHHISHHTVAHAWRMSDPTICACHLICDQEDQELIDQLCLSALFEACLLGDFVDVLVLRCGAASLRNQSAIVILLRLFYPVSGLFYSRGSMEPKTESHVDVNSLPDGEFNYELGDPIQGQKGGTKQDVRDMFRMGKQQELRVGSYTSYAIEPETVCNVLIPDEREIFVSSPSLAL